MLYTVISARRTLFQGQTNKVSVVSLPSNRIEVAFTGTMACKDDSNIDRNKKLPDRAYRGIIDGLKKLHESNTIEVERFNKR